MTKSAGELAALAAAIMSPFAGAWLTNKEQTMESKCWKCRKRYGDEVVKFDAVLRLCLECKHDFHEALLVGELADFDMQLDIAQSLYAASVNNRQDSDADIENYYNVMRKKSIELFEAIRRWCPKPPPMEEEALKEYGLDKMPDPLSNPESP
jgi:hypothetical protein